MSYEDLAEYIIENYGWISLVMIAILTGIIQVLKIPIKKLTSHIKNDKLRHLANKSIILLSFGLSFGLDYLCHIAFPTYFPYSFATALVEGAFSNILYLMGEGVITKSQAKTLVDNVKDITSDGKVSADEAVAIAKQTDAMAKETAAAKQKSDVEKFNDLIGK